MASNRKGVVGLQTGAPFYILFAIVALMLLNGNWQASRNNLYKGNLRALQQVEGYTASYLIAGCGNEPYKGAN